MLKSGLRHFIVLLLWKRFYDPRENHLKITHILLNNFFVALFGKQALVELAN